MSSDEKPVEPGVAESNLMSLSSSSTQEDVFLRLLELKAKYSAVSQLNSTHGGLASSDILGEQIPSLQSSKRRKVGVDQDALHNALQVIFSLQGGSVHLEVLVAFVRMNWAKLCPKISDLSSSVEIKQILLHHLENFRLSELEPVYTPSPNDPSVWLLVPHATNLNTRTETHTCLTEVVASALKALKEALPTAGSLVSVVDAIVSWIRANSSSALLLFTAAEASPSFLGISLESQIELVLRHDPAVLEVLSRYHLQKLLPDGDDHDFPVESETPPIRRDDEELEDESTSIKKNRPVRRAAASGKVNAPATGLGQPFAAGSAVQAAKQRRLQQQQQQQQHHSSHSHRHANTRRQLVNTSNKLRSRSSGSHSSAMVPPSPSQPVVQNGSSPSFVPMLSDGVSVSLGALGLQISSAAATAARQGTMSPPPQSTCTQCREIISGSGWYRGPTLTDWHCQDCGEIWSREHACPVCGLVYDEEDDGDDIIVSTELFESMKAFLLGEDSNSRGDTVSSERIKPSGEDQLAPSEPSSWIACDDCGRWVMTKCDGITDLSLYDDDNPSHLPYHCPLCRGAKTSISRVFFTRLTAPQFASAFLLSSKEKPKPPPPIHDSSTVTIGPDSSTCKRAAANDTALGDQLPGFASSSIDSMRSATALSPAPAADVRLSDLRPLHNVPMSPLTHSISTTAASTHPDLTPKSKGDAVSRLNKSERLLLEEWQQRRAQLDEDSDSRMTKSKMDKIKVLERKFIDEVSSLRENLAKAMSSLLEKNRQDFDTQLARLRKEKDLMDQLVESEISQEFEAFFNFKSEQLNNASDAILSETNYLQSPDG